MTLNIDTFSAAAGGNAFYKAISHPLAAEAISRLLDGLRPGGLALYDPHSLLAGFAALHDLAGIEVAGVFGQKVEEIGRTVCGHVVRPVTDLPRAHAVHVLVLAFDAGRTVAQIRHLLPAAAELHTLDAARLPDDLLGNRARYLDPLNFATNHAFFRDAAGQHTRLVTANYWERYGPGPLSLWCRLFDGGGQTLATWRQPVPEGAATIVIDSAAVRERFGLPDFTGQLFIHAVGARGHDAVKYVLDTYDDSGAGLSATHDANAWPADLYAGLPAPAPGERVVLWLQNSHAAAIPAGAIAVGMMGGQERAWVERPVAGFATIGLDVAELHPQARWPRQFELFAGRHVVRPRYEVVRNDGRRRIAHMNVERSDTVADRRLATLSGLLGKGFLLPAPLLPVADWRTEVLPTPMATGQADLPLAMLVYDPSGGLVLRRPLGRLPRAGCPALDLDELLPTAALPASGGHVEIVYDLDDGGEMDGWLHAIFRYRHRRSGHAAETSFGAHVFNTVLTYGGEPQSYAGPPPGLSTRLFLRLGALPVETICQLIYPASTPWHPRSATDLILHDGNGHAVARRRVEIACGGSLLWRFSETFDAASRRAAGVDGHLIVRDATCRLFGYAGLFDPSGAFSFDHMFGF